MTTNRFVLDTTLIISALLLPCSVSRRAFDMAFDQGIVLVSVATLEELDDVVRRKKFDRYVIEEKRLQFLEAFIRDSLLVDVTERVTDCRDPNNNKFLELAISGHAVNIISGDTDLPVLHPFRGIPIVPPHVFVSQSCCASEQIVATDAAYVGKIRTVGGAGCCTKILTGSIGCTADFRRWNAHQNHRSYTTRSDAIFDTQQVTSQPKINEGAV